MVSLLDQKKYLHNFYDKQLSELKVSVAAFWILVEKVSPKLWNHIVFFFYKKENSN